MPAVTINVDAILFDMDGTLVDSVDGVKGAWATFKQKYHGIDIHEILQTSHGIRTVDNLRKHCGITDPDELEREALRFELAIVDTSAQEGRPGIVPLPGTKEIMQSLSSADGSSRPLWAICTSATRAYATKALQISNITLPKVFVAAEDVEKGKPYPDPYLLGAKLCGVSPERCLVVEDAPTGIRSGKSAGCITVGLKTTHSIEQVKEAGPDYTITNLSRISVRLVEDGIEVTIDED